MITNKEKALQFYKEETALDINDPTSIVIETIEIASKPDWYYPSKGEFPELYQLVNIVKENNCISSATYHKEYWYDRQFACETNVTAWTYLPKYS